MAKKGATTPPAKKRKPAEDAAEKPAESPAKPQKKPKTSANPAKSAGKSTKKATKVEDATDEEQTEQAEGAAVEVKRDEEEPEDVAMEAAEDEKEKDLSPAKPKAKAKPGRRRLRQRVVADDEDSESDLDLPFTLSKSTKTSVDAAPGGEGHVIDMTSPFSPSEEPKTPQKKQKEKPSPSPSASKKNGKKDKKEEVQESKIEEAEKEATNGDQDAKEEEEEKAGIAATPVKTSRSPKKLKPVTGFFTKQPSKTKTPAKEKKASMDNEAKTKKQTTAEKESAQPDDENSDEPRVTPYVELAKLFSKIEEVSGRLVIQDLLLNFFRDVIRRAPDDLLACIYLCVCVDLAPPFENLKIGIGDAILMKAIGEATGTNLKFIKEMYHKEGDLGKVAQNARSKQHTLSFAAVKPAAKPNPLSVQHVYDQFVKIAKMTGNNSQQQKCSIIKGLLVKCEKDKKTQSKGSEGAEGAKYIIRGLQGKLRIGLAEKSILIGLTYAFMTEKEQKDKEKQQEALAWVKKAFAECPSYNALVAAFQDVQKEVSTAPLLRAKDFAKVAAKCVLTPGTPVSPMLARPTKAYAMVFDRFEGKPFTCEYKYDGERAQIHILPDGEIAIFSRNFENSTERFPDVKLAILEAAKKKSVVKSCIVDAEVVAVDRASNKRLPFQVLSTRSRKNVKVEDIKVPVCIYAFDLLSLNGESYLGEPLAKRRELLRDMFEVSPGHFEFASSLDVTEGVEVKDDAEQMEEAVATVRTFLEEAVRENCEGLMVKTLTQEATYEPANRSHKWLKLKKDYLDGIGDSTDLVPIGAFHGRGKRTGVYGAYLLACYDPDTEMFQPITKLGTGLSDEVLKQFHEQLKEKVVSKPPSDYAIGEGIKPDVWFEASTVWEILGADLSISPKYTAAMGLVAKDKGISLRFPRFLRIREDKDPAQATTSSQIADLYRAQGLTTVTNGAEEEDDDMLI